MAWTPIDGSVPQYSTEDNELASGYYLKFYQSGTTTPFSMATDSTGNVKLAKCKLNARGMPITNPLDDDTVFIPHVDQTYRIVLYKNETDADNDTTANAEYNVDGIAPDVAPLADASDITLRTNNLEAWDDYDRSPLFVDGTDFTAGAGPHTITVPSGWNPTDTDMRFWRLDAPSSSVESLTPTSVTSSSFTLAETLLSTDVIFIGDDQFRNIHDGDPADIRTRLDVYSTSEADSAFLDQTEGDARYLQLSDFDPTSPTLVWSGSTSGGVAMSSLSESGTGSYVIKDNTNDSYQLYVLDLDTDSIGGAAFFSGTVARQAYFRRTDDTFFLFEYNSDTGAFVGNVTITEIYKL